jgi:hypothetical protein
MLGRIRCNHINNSDSIDVVVVPLVLIKQKQIPSKQIKHSNTNAKEIPPIEKMKTDDTLASTCDNVYDIAGGRKTTTTADIMEAGGGGGKDEMAVLVSVGQDDVVAFAYENESVPSLESEDDEDDDEEEEDEDWESDDDEEEDEEGELMLTPAFVVSVP